VNLVDTHTHLFLPAFNQDREEIVQSAIDSGVNRMLLPDIDSSTTASMISLADAYPDHCLPMAGLHPTSVKDDFSKEIDKIRDLLIQRKFWGIGETGIDLYWDKKYLEQQVESLKIHISLAKEYKLPLIIHCRDSFSEIVDILDNQDIDEVVGIFHAFTGTLEQARKIISYGFKIGIGGIVTFKNSGLDQTLKEIEPIHLVLETDSPYLTPTPHRGKRNESSYLILIAEKLAEIYNRPLEEIAEITTRNANELFGLETQIK
jgi:TatD DNase family protein